MKQTRARWCLVFLAASCLLSTGCIDYFLPDEIGGKTRPPSYANVSPLMKRLAFTNENAPVGETLVCIHAPPDYHDFHTGVWDSGKLIGVLGNGQSMAYRCDPGKHYFISRFIAHSTQNVYVAMVEAELLPDNTYDLMVYVTGLSPVKPGSTERSQVPTWARSNHWITRRPSAAEYEQATAPEIESIRNEFVGGKIHTDGQYVSSPKVGHLSPNDHR